MGRSGEKTLRDVHVPLVIELQTHRNFGETAFTIVCSIPNREGTFARTWRCLGGTMDSVDARDMTGWIEKMVLEAFFGLGGIQQTLIER